MIETTTEVVVQEEIVTFAITVSRRNLQLALGSDHLQGQIARRVGKLAQEAVETHFLDRTP